MSGNPRDALDPLALSVAIEVGVFRRLSFSDLRVGGNTFVGGQPLASDGGHNMYNMALDIHTFDKPCSLSFGIAGLDTEALQTKILSCSIRGCFTDSLQWFPKRQGRKKSKSKKASGLHIDREIRVLFLDISLKLEDRMNSCIYIERERDAEKLAGSFVLLIDNSQASSEKETIAA
jgi:hypothetical protein